MMHRLFKLEREAEKRVHDARDREIDLGGPGSARRASEAMDAPMLEVAKIRKMRQRLGDNQMAIDHQSNLLRRTRRNPGLSSEVKGHRIGQVETKLAGLKADFSALEVEAEQRFFPVAARVDGAESVGEIGDGTRGGSNDTKSTLDGSKDKFLPLDKETASAEIQGLTSGRLAFIGPGGEGQPNESPEKQAPSVVDVGPPSLEPVDPRLMYKQFGFDSNGPGEVARTLEHPFKAWRANQLFNEAVAVTRREAQNGSFVMWSPESNAFTHAYGSYRMAQEFGPILAKQFADSHEISVVNPDGQRLKDLYNNNVGRQLALDPDNQGRFAEHVVLDALQDGKLQAFPFRVKSSTTQDGTIR